MVVFESGNGINGRATRVNDDTTSVLATFPGGESATIIEDMVVLNLNTHSRVSGLLDGNTVDTSVENNVVVDEESASVISGAGSVDTLSIFNVVLLVGTVSGRVTITETSDSRGLVERHEVTVSVDDIVGDGVVTRALALSESDGGGSCSGPPGVTVDHVGIEKNIIGLLGVNSSRGAMMDVVVLDGNVV